MKYEYIKSGKLNYQGNQYRTGAILELDGLGNLPGNWFHEVKEEKIVKIKIKIEEKPEKIVVKSNTKKEGVIDNGNNINTNKNMGR